MYLQTKKLVVRDIKGIKKRGASDDLVAVLNHIVSKSQFFRDQAKEKGELRCRSYERALNLLCTATDIVAFWRRSKNEIKLDLK